MSNLYHKVAVASVCTALGFVLGASPEGKAATFAPTIIFEVVDGGHPRGLYFDGRGDYLGVGSAGYIQREVTRDQGQFAEFNISSLSLAPNTVISSAVLQTQIRAFPMTGYGVVNYSTFGYYEVQ
jgi:hypothetical protein